MDEHERETVQRAQVASAGSAAAEPSQDDAARTRPAPKPALGGSTL